MFQKLKNKFAKVKYANITITKTKGHKKKLRKTMFLNQPQFEKKTIISLSFQKLKTSNSMW